MRNDSFDADFEAAGKAYNVDPRLLKVVFHIESGGNPNTRDSSAGAQGGMQIMPATARGLGVLDPRDMKQAIPGAAKYLAMALDKTGSAEGALAFYHAGPDTSGWGPKTAAYIDKGMRMYPQIQMTTLGNKQIAAAGDASSVRGLFNVDGDAPSATKEQKAEPSVRELFRTEEDTVLAPPAPEDPASIVMPSRFQKRGGPVNKIDLSANPMTVAEGFDALRAGLAPSPGTTYGDVLPLAKDDATGAVRMAMPNMVRSFLSGAVDLAQGPGGMTIDPSGNPLTARLTPDATGALMMVPGRSVAAGTGKAIADFANAPFVRERINMGRGAAEGNLLIDRPRPGSVASESPSPRDVTQSVGAVAAAEARAAAARDAAVNPIAGGTVPPGVAINPMLAGRPGVSETGQIGTPLSPSARAAGAAAASPEEATMAERVMLANRSTAEKQKLNQPQPNGPDTNIYVKDVNPSLADMEQRANISREQKMIESAIPDEFKATAREHNEARARHFAEIAQSPVAEENAVAARGAMAERDLAATWKNKKETDATSVLELAKTIKESPDGRRPLVRSAVDSVVDELHKDGKLLADPEMLYGVRKHIGDLLSKEAKASDPKSARAEAALLQLQKELDIVIEAGAPGFKEYLKNFSAASRPIDEMRVLQRYENKLYDTQGRMQLSRVQAMMKDIVTARDADGINEYKSITDETMAKLWALRDDLRRVASAQELAKARGSDTVQNTMDVMKNVGSAAANVGAHAAANWASPFLGSMALFAGQSTLKAVRDRRAARNMQNRANEMLNPDRSKIQPPLD